MSEDILGIKYLYRMHSGIILISPKLVPLNCRFLQWRHCSSQVVNLNFFRPGATDPDLQLYLNSVLVVHRYSKTRQSSGLYSFWTCQFYVCDYWILTEREMYTCMTCGPGSFHEVMYRQML